MQKDQLSSVNSSSTVLSVLEPFADKLSEAARECQQDLSEQVARIMECSQQQVARQGLAAEKRQARNGLGEIAMTVAGALCSYGASIDDDRLVAACGYSRSTLFAGRDALLIGRCSGLLDEASKLVEKLGKFQVTPATLTAFKAAIDAFDAVRTAPRDGIARSAAATRHLRTLLRQMRRLLSKRLDPLIASMAATEPVLFHQYKVARKLVHAPTISIEPEDKVVPAAMAVPASVPEAKAA